MPLPWESEFFALPSARLLFSDDAPALTPAALTAYAVVQAKVASSDLAQIDALSARGFQLAESEVDLCLPIAAGEVTLPAWPVRPNLVLNSANYFTWEVLNNHSGLAISPTLLGSLVVMGGAVYPTRCHCGGCYRQVV